MLETLRVFGSVEPIPLFGGDCRCTSLAGETFLQDSIVGERSSVLLNAGRTLYYQQRYVEAIHVLKQASPNKTYLPLFEYFLGASYLCLDEGVQSAQYWRNDLIAQDAFMGIYRCGIVGEERRSATLYDLALTMQPDLATVEYKVPSSAIVHYLAAAGVARRRQLQDIELRWLQIGLGKFPRNPLANYRMGDYHERLGDIALANIYYKDALTFSDIDDTSNYVHYIRTSFALERWSNGAAAIGEFINHVDPEDNQIDAIVTLVKQHPEPELCNEMIKVLSDINRPNHNHLLQMIANIQNVCEPLPQPEKDS
jgi:tetratricopeptide (TPR) repeat protein